MTALNSTMLEDLGREKRNSKATENAVTHRYARRKKRKTGTIYCTHPLPLIKLMLVC
jgi:hypothetical protein